MLVGFGEGAADYAPADEDDLGYEAVGLCKKVASASAAIVGSR